MYLLDTNILLELILDQERADEVEALLGNATQFGLDFDDAYQLTAAQKHALTLVSFDTHFDKTPGGRKTPSELN